MNRQGVQSIHPPSRPRRTIFIRPSVHPPYGVQTNGQRHSGYSAPDGGSDSTGRNPIKPPDSAPARTNPRQNPSGNPFGMSSAIAPYGVDRNPLAVDLCRVALWLESRTAGEPLTFLDHRIRCGDSLVGAFDLGVLAQGIPDKPCDP
jgi:hypothetical protein